jgi:hypothetical protein
MPCKISKQTFLFQGFSKKCNFQFAFEGNKRLLFSHSRGFGSGFEAVKIRVKLFFQIYAAEIFEFSIHVTLDFFFFNLTPPPSPRKSSSNCDKIIIC